MTSIVAVTMPKWGLSMEEGKIVHWWKAPGESVRAGDDLLDVETTKITNTAESIASGILRRIVAATGVNLPVGALLAVIADEAASNEDIERFVEEFESRFVPAAHEAAANALEPRKIEVGDTFVQVAATRGEGRPIVLLHGFGSDLNNWLFNIDFLALAAPVIALDLPGHGGSGKKVGDGALDQIASTVADALAKIGVREADLVGHSLGAAVAVRIALDRPDLVRSLTLIAPAGLPGSKVSAAFLDAFVDAQRARDLKPVLEQLVADPRLISRDMVENVLRYKRLDGAQEALSAFRDRLADGADFLRLQSHLAEIPAALVIVSRGDAVVTAPDEAALPDGWRVVWIDGAGHMPHLERAAEVNALILGAVKD